MSDTYIYGYVRVSTQKQDLNRQLDLLNQYNCIKMLTEKITKFRLTVFQAFSQFERDTIVKNKTRFKKC